MTYVIESDELYHHGRLHQKWGVRNGPPYPLSGSATQGYAAKQEKKTGTADKPAKPKHSSEAERHAMTDAELDARVKRLEKETRLKELERKNVDAGSDFVRTVMSDAGKATLKAVVTATTLYAAKAFLNKQFDAGELGKAIFDIGVKKKK